VSQHLSAPLTIVDLGLFDHTLDGIVDVSDFFFDLLDWSLLKWGFTSASRRLVRKIYRPWRDDRTLTPFVVCSV
jgi:hypothetical protein